MKTPFGKRIWILFLFIFMLSACATSGEETPAGEESDPLPPVAAVRAREVLATELNVGIEEVSFQTFVPMDWGDSCLELGGPAESCLAAIHPGWLVKLIVGESVYEVHTDELGDIIRIK